MPRALPKYVEKNAVGGHVYLSFRRGKGPRIKLPPDPTSPEFHEAYAAALAGEAVAMREAKRETVQDGTIAALIISYRKSAGFVELRATSKAGYMSRLDAIRIRVVQQKTGAKLMIRLHRDLAPVLAAVDRQHLVIVATEYGKPFTVDGFGQFMRDAITAAKLPLACQPHGLRKAAGRRLAEAGCSARMIMAVLDHKTLAEAERYTRDADQAGLASDAISLQEARIGNRVTQTVPLPFGEVAKTEGKSE